MTTWTRCGDSRHTTQYEAEINGALLTIRRRQDGCWDVEDADQVLTRGLSNRAAAEAEAERLARRTTSPRYYAITWTYGVATTDDPRRPEHTKRCGAYVSFPTAAERDSWVKRGGLEIPAE